MKISKRRILMNAFFKSQFSYFPLVGMCHSRANNGKINRLHERCLRIIHSDKQSLFEMLLENDGSASLHNRNLQILATEMYKIKNNVLSPLIVTELFEQRNEQHYDLRKKLSVHYTSIKNSISWVGSISYLRPKIWNILPDSLKNVNSIEAFKMQIKKWKPENCPCQLCKVYVQNVGFV